MQFKSKKAHPVSEYREGRDVRVVSIARLTFASGALGAFYGCSTAEMAPPIVLPATPPPYVQVQHPGGYGIGDLNAIFIAADAPKPEEIRECDADLKKLRAATPSQAEHIEGTRELVRREPQKYHWCFYGKILKLENDLKTENYLDEKQKSVLETYATLTPIARAFMQEFHDSRYLRWAIKHYKSVSEWIFYRKVEMTPQTTSDLVEAANPFGMLREPTAVTPVLEKYGIKSPGSSGGAGSGSSELGNSSSSAIESEGAGALPTPGEFADGDSSGDTPPPPPEPERAPASTAGGAPGSWDNPPAGPPPFPDNSKFPAAEILDGKGADSKTSPQSIPTPTAPMRVHATVPAAPERAPAAGSKAPTEPKAPTAPSTAPAKR